MRVLITGGRHGLGRALADHARGLGHDVVVVDREAGDGRGGDGGQTIVADLADTAGLDELADRLIAVGPFDVVIQNAGINFAGAFDGVPMTAHRDIVAVNLVAPMVLTARLLEAGAIGGSGAMVFVGSLATAVGYPGAASYAASKAGLMNFARNIHPGWRAKRTGRGVRCVCIYPGPLRTAHAAQNAPRGARADGRLAPEIAAREIWDAVLRGSGSATPGWRAKVARRLAILAPRLADRLMRRVVFVPLQRDGAAGEAGLAAAVGAEADEAPAEDVVLAGGSKVA